MFCPEWDPEIEDSWRRAITGASGRLHGMMVELHDRNFLGTVLFC